MIRYMSTPPNGPYCSNCKYNLTGLTESSKCPECGRPLVEVLQRPEWRPPRFAGRRYASPVRIFGLPLVHVAFGPDGAERYGKARGIIAIGDAAFGLLALGGQAVGVIAFGGASVGIVALGGFGIGLISFAGFALGLLMAFGGCSVGGIASGGGALGIVADGGFAIGSYARGGKVMAQYAISSMRRDPEALAFFSDWQWLLGGPFGLFGFNITLIGWGLLGALMVGVLTAFPCLVAYLIVLRRTEHGDARH